MKKLLLISLFIMAIVLSGCGAKYDPDYSEPSIPEINNANIRKKVPLTQYFSTFPGMFHHRIR